MRDSLRILLFSLALGLVCASLLTAASFFLRDRQEANRQAEKLRNVFAVLDVAFEEDAPATDLLRLIRSKDNPGGKVTARTTAGLGYYRYDHPAEGVLRAFELEGPGLWGPVKGLVCLKADLQTVFRVSFYQQEETPGLGAEIGTPLFTSRFAGRTIVPPAGGPPGIRVVRPGTEAGPNVVDGISGATLTCDKVGAMLREVCRRILEHRPEILREDEP